MVRACIVFASLAAILVAGCEDPPDQQTGAAVVVEHMATGTFNSFDPAAGTVNLSHTPVPSADWPAMTMDFKLADSGAAAELKPGERVDFHFKIESGMNATVTLITPLE
jgi:membrane fusion protein, copper/silver efflux system